MGEPHRPVMLDRVVALLAQAPDGVIVDATLGAGGHAAAVAAARVQRHGQAHIVGLDRDPDALDLAGERLARVEGLHLQTALTRFDAVGDVLDDLGVGRIAGFLLDLGISSMHVDQPERGFSYRHDGPLDMRMGPDAPQTAAELIASSTEQELARILAQWGEERFAQRIARAIKQVSTPSTTTELAAIVRDAIPAAARRHGGHPATRTFQALRIAVNGELEALERVLPVLLDRLAPAGVGVVLSYHSLEDRLVKRAFTDAATGCTCPPDLPVCACGRVPLVEHLVRRPERPGDDEVAANPRASAARLRAVRRSIATEAT
jgi:16S rRNA (cytosine1402-N4)-methyltransferase